MVDENGEEVSFDFQILMVDDAIFDEYGGFMKYMCSV